MKPKTSIENAHDYLWDLTEKTLIEKLEQELGDFCHYCYDTGYHLCPDVAEPILIKCTSKKCVVNK